MSTIATKSKKAARIESALLNKLALMGQKTFARAMGVPEYQVSRWKNGFFSQVSMMLAVLEYGIEDDEMAELTKRLANYLTKKKPRRTANSSRPDVERLDQSTGVIMTNTAKYSTSAEVTLPDRSVMWQISMMVTPDYQICCLRLIRAQI